MTLLDWLVQKYPTAKRTTLKRMVEAGRVTVGGRRARRLKDEVAPDAEVRVDEGPTRAAPPARAAVAARLPFDILFEDPDLLVVNKPAGLLTSTVPREPRPTLLAAVRAYVAQTDPDARVGLIHRLDRDAAGVLVFSKSDEAYQSLKTQFFKHTVTRVYTALVEGVPTPREGRIESRLVERGDGTVRSTKQHARGERAITDYALLSTHAGRSLVRVTLFTGRKHQIRVHLSERGTPIVGDELYGKPEEGGLRLAATMLEIDHPKTGTRMKFEVPPPWEAAPATAPAAPKRSR